MTHRIQYNTRISIDSATFTGSFQSIGILSDDAILVKIVNNSGVDIDVSIDGTNSVDFVPANSFVLYDIQTNHGFERKFAFPKNTNFFVKGTASTGSVYLVSFSERK